ncbi:mechanosensitive ion channel family protein [Aquimarina sp. BL5]|uniref:mechanosensitive ion channel family protein n=1 Tax=Aquimarina sp. BL5 TaxID=1714860 RepID=UPI000E46D07D|nr:mechanosensitive ion channel domain-containing protein [Aquimarina sp. BL5]AXT53075.1 mechanosensitive ion channel family protein [Aquimarina sp. BL5]RKM92135.1 mechanosensitive ion channel family protein [Aquimarina sp. BL5]
MEKLGLTGENWEQFVKWVWDFVPGLFSAIVIFFVGIWVINLISRGLRKFFQKKDYDETLERFLYDLINIGLKILLIILVVTQLGVQTSSLVAILGAAGLAVGLALQGSLANFAGGVLILFFKPFKIGDFIETQGVSGTVKEISIFTTKLNTFGNQLAVIPNGKVSNGNIINYSSEDKRRDKIEIGIAYTSNIKEAKDILLDLINNQEKVLKDPAPEIYVSDLGDSAVTLSLRYWATNEDFWAVHFYTIEEAKKRLEDKGVSIPFPQREIRMISDNKSIQNAEKKDS